MELGDIRPEDSLGELYIKHSIFDKLIVYSDFYDALSDSVMRWVGTLAVINYLTPIHIPQLRVQ